MDFCSDFIPHFAGKHGEFTFNNHPFKKTWRITNGGMNLSASKLGVGGGGPNFTASLLDLGAFAVTRSDRE